jgi:hypothetical protein
MLSLLLPTCQGLSSGERTPSRLGVSSNSLPYKGPAWRPRGPLWGRQDAGATSNDAVADGVQHGLQAGMHPRLAQHVADVIANGGGADIQLGGDLLGIAALAEQGQDAALARGSRGQEQALGCRTPPDDFAGKVRGESRIQAAPKQLLKIQRDRIETGDWRVVMR